MRDSECGHDAKKVLPALAHDNKCCKKKKMIVAFENMPKTDGNKFRKHHNAIVAVGFSRVKIIFSLLFAVLIVIRFIWSAYSEKTARESRIRVSVPSGRRHE